MEVHSSPACTRAVARESRWRRGPDRTIAVIAAVMMLIPLARGALAADSDQFRPYALIQATGSYFSDPNSALVNLKNPSQFPFTSFAIGANTGRYLGFELALDYTETNLDANGAAPDGGFDTIGEYALWHILGMARLRYPMMHDRLVPYALGGAGLGIAEFNDGNRFTFQFDGTANTSFIGTLGAGLEYFVARNITFGLEAKYILGFDSKVTVQGQDQSLDLDNLLLSAGMRLYFDGAGGSGLQDARPPPADTDRRRVYIALGLGGAFFTDPDSSGVMSISTPTRTDWSAAVGVNFNRHWGVELSGAQWETTVDAPPVGELAEYAMWALVLHLRWRYPLYEDRFVPYLLAGGGIGSAQINDPRVPPSYATLDNSNPITGVGSFGGGLEYFLEHNIAFDAQARYVVPFKGTTAINGQPVELNNESLLFTVGLKVYFP